MRGGADGDVIDSRGGHERPCQLRRPRRRGRRHAGRWRQQRQLDRRAGELPRPDQQRGAHRRVSGRRLPHREQRREHAQRRGGNDRIQGGAGTDSLNGDASADSVDYSYRTDAQPAAVSLDGVKNDGAGTTRTRSARPSSRSSAARAATRCLVAQAANTIDGGGGTDTIDGLAGEDTVSAAPGTTTSSPVTAASTRSTAARHDTNNADAATAAPAASCPAPPDTGGGGGGTTGGGTSGGGTTGGGTTGGGTTTTPLKTMAVTVSYGYAPKSPKKSTTFSAFMAKNVPKGSKLVARCVTKQGQEVQGQARQELDDQEDDQEDRPARRASTRSTRPAAARGIVSKAGFKTQVKIVQVPRTRPRTSSRAVRRRRRRGARPAEPPVTLLRAGSTRVGPARCALLALAAAAVCSAMPGVAAAAPGPVPGEVVVGFEHGANGSERAAARRVAGVTTERGSRLDGVQLVKVAAGELVSARRSPASIAIRSVEYAQPNRSCTASATSPNDPSFGQLWGLDNTGQSINGVAGVRDADIDAPEASNMGFGLGSTVPSRSSTRASSTTTPTSRRTCGPTPASRPGAVTTTATGSSTTCTGRLRRRRRGWASQRRQQPRGRRPPRHARRGHDRRQAHAQRARRHRRGRLAAHDHVRDLVGPEIVAVKVPDAAGSGSRRIAEGVRLRRQDGSEGRQR